jgi:hypothetical protein
MAKRKKSGPPETVVAFPRRPRVTSLKGGRASREMLVSSDAPPKAAAFAYCQLFSPSERIGPLPEEAPKLSLEKVIQALHDCEINVGLNLQSFYDCGLNVCIGDELNGLEAKASLEANRDGTYPATALSRSGCTRRP